MIVLSVVTIIRRNITIFRRPRTSCARRDCRRQFRGHKGEFTGTSIGHVQFIPHETSLQHRNVAPTVLSGRETAVILHHETSAYDNLFFRFYSTLLFFSPHFLFRIFFMPATINVWEFFALGTCMRDVESNRYQSFARYERAIVADLFLRYFNRGRQERENMVDRIVHTWIRLFQRLKTRGNLLVASFYRISRSYLYYLK